MICCHLVAWCHFTVLLLNPDCMVTGERTWKLSLILTQCVFIELFFQTTFVTFFNFLILVFNFVPYPLPDLFSPLTKYTTISLSYLKIYEFWEYLGMDPLIIEHRLFGWIQIDDECDNDDPQSVVFSIRFILIRKCSSQWPISSDCFCLFSSTLSYPYQVSLACHWTNWRGVLRFISQVQENV